MTHLKLHKVPFWDLHHSLVLNLKSKEVDNPKLVLNICYSTSICFHGNLVCMYVCWDLGLSLNFNFHSSTQQGWTPPFGGSRRICFCRSADWKKGPWRIWSGYSAPWPDQYPSALVCTLHYRRGCLCMWHKSQPNTLKLSKNIERMENKGHYTSKTTIHWTL